MTILLSASSDRDPDKIYEAAEVLSKDFLDSINKLKVSLNNRVEKLKQIDSLFAQLTWVDIKSKEDEELIKKIIIDSKKFHSKLLRNYVNLKNSQYICYQNQESQNQYK